MPKIDYLGQFEQCVLLAVLRLHENAYGMTIRRELQERTGRPTSLGAVYTTLSRLETKGYVSSWVGDPTPERGGRAKKFFKIEAAGAAALKQAHQAYTTLATGLEPSVGVL
jgi:PadR family transcriptional regulator